jgi:hypothetical protein
MERKARGGIGDGLGLRWLPVRDLDDYKAAVVVPSYPPHSASPSLLVRQQERQDSAPQQWKLSVLLDS